MSELSAREEADVVLIHLGYAPLMACVVNCAKVLYDTEAVDYEIARDHDGGDTSPSTLVIQPQVKLGVDFARIRENRRRLHRFIDLCSHPLYMMTCVSESFIDDPAPVGADSTDDGARADSKDASE